MSNPQLNAPAQEGENKQEEKVDVVKYTTHDLFSNIWETVDKLARAKRVVIEYYDELFKAMRHYIVNMDKVLAVEVTRASVEFYMEDGTTVKVTNKVQLVYPGCAK
jgi:uncharacterized protein YjlB